MEVEFIQLIAIIMLIFVFSNLAFPIFFGWKFIEMMVDINRIKKELGLRQHDR